MFVMDVPDVPPQLAPIVIAQKAQAIQKGPNRTIGVCQPIENKVESRLSAVNSVAPILEAYSYLKDVEHVKIDESVVQAAKMSLLQAPAHGLLDLDEQTQTARYFSADYSYVGPDRATVLVEIGGYKVTLKYFFELMQDVPGSGDQGSALDDKTICPKGPVWRISFNPEDPTAPIYTIQNPHLLMSRLADVIGKVEVDNLPSSTAAQTTGTRITLDDNAAGHGWYLDPTPQDNSDDYLPTSNPNIWQAKAGSDAAGKMDLLSVLLHEYGHALGLDHSAASGDFMAATLQPGQRRLPSAEELQLMSELVAELKAGTSTGDSSPTNPAVPSLPLGALLLGRLALGRRPEDAVFDGSQALFAAHPTLQGGGLQNLQDWATQGKVTVAGGGGATLQEGAASQTRLNQVFTINERDRFLSFTLAGTALDDVNGGPDDAFEVALLEADTGRSLTGALSLSHTDALLNLQANGTETAAANVTRITNPDGSRTYRVDLAGVPAGTAVNLSFDLIGFGKAGSQVTVRDVRVSGLPQLHDDAATLAEDGTLAFDPFAQVDNAAILALGSQVVDAPAHGSVSVNTDGTFVYTPQANYNGADSYT